MQQTIPRLPAVWSEAFPCSLHCGVFCLLLQCLRQFLQNEPHDEVRAEGHVLQRQPVSFYILPADGMGMLGGCPRDSTAHKLGDCHQGPLDTKGAPGVHPQQTPVLHLHELRGRWTLHTLGGTCWWPSQRSELHRVTIMLWSNWLFLLWPTLLFGTSAYQKSENLGMASLTQEIKHLK